MGCESVSDWKLSKALNSKWGPDDLEIQFAASPFLSIPEYLLTRTDSLRWINLQVGVRSRVVSKNIAAYP